MRDVRVFSSGLMAGIFVGVGSLVFAGSLNPANPDLNPGPVTPFTQNDPQYQRAMEHLANALRLLDKARLEVKQSQHAWMMPGFRYDQLHSDIDAIVSQLSPVLVPRQRRLEYQRLVPDGDYLLPPDTTDGGALLPETIN